MPKIYVGTYKKYAEGSIKGAWLDLEDYVDKDEFIAACLELHKDEVDPELQFQDWEDIPSTFIGECSIDDEFWDYMNYDDRHDGEAKAAYMACFNEWSESDFEDRFRGKFDSWAEMAEEFCDSCGILDQIPENLRYYFDFERYANDISLNGDMVEDEGYFFWNH